MISNSYSTARMWALTKRYAVENRRNIFITLGVMFGIIFLMSLLFTKTCPHDYDWRDSERGAILWIIYAFIAGLVVQITGSLTFSSMSTKSKRISNMMLPAKQSEKFISQCLLYVIGGNIALILSLILADTLSSVIFGFVPGWYYLPQNLDISDLITDLPYGLNILFVAIFGGMWLFLFGQAIYVLGSTLWPKKSFLKTYIALFALQIIVPILMPWNLIGDGFNVFAHWFEGKEFTSLQGWLMVWAIIIFLYALIVGVYHLAWQRYRRLEIVKRFL
ncbi:MAG: hypothetical protein NC301_05080 [Bacteroides sp.]|nr:hypothetical protein [Bacteroides sp.]MCM1379809.1 hypothetical protein [Bacteroides sp.]MCM1446168.1 hypothetical protein [Prevotella sp.]